MCHCDVLCDPVPPWPQGIAMERKDAKVEKEEAEKYRNLQTEIVSEIICCDRARPPRSLSVPPGGNPLLSPCTGFQVDIRKKRGEFVHAHILVITRMCRLISSLV